MHCPKCLGRVQVREFISGEDNESYRLRECSECGHKFYTIEFEVEQNERLMEDLKKFRREKYKAYRSKEYVE